MWKNGSMHLQIIFDSSRIGHKAAIRVHTTGHDMSQNNGTIRQAPGMDP